MVRRGSAVQVRSAAPLPNKLNPYFLILNPILSKFAIIGIGGKQFRAEEGAILETEKIGEEGATVKLNHVFLVADGDEVKIGTPLVEGASVEVKILEVKKGEKIRVFKMKARKRYHRERGHRQIVSKVEVVKIVG